MPETHYENWMREAITQAEKGRLLTWPNPAVGAVLVKDDVVVASGYHRGAGLPHAEIECLANAREKGVDPAGATLVVTLEPCRHTGRTPPCVDAILEAGIKTVVYGAPDPNPEAAGGARFLAEKGVEVVGPVSPENCEDLIADFKVFLEGTRPYVILKLAATLDGRIATRNGASRWISGEVSRATVHETRARIGKMGGAILVGGGAFRVDNPELTARGDGYDGPQPLACVLTSRLPKADADIYLLRNRPEQTVFFSSPAAAASTTAEALRKLGCRVLALTPGMRDGSEFQSLFRQMRDDLKIPYVMCEGGGKLALGLLEAGYVDEFHLHLAPMILGDNDAKPLFNGRAPLSLDEALNMRLRKVAISGGDALLLLRPGSRA